MGVGYYAGLLTGAAGSYTNWNLTENGVTTTNTDYITTKITDLAIDWKDAQTKPWFLWLAYTAPHTPFQKCLNSLRKYKGSLQKAAANTPH